MILKCLWVYKNVKCYTLFVISYSIIKAHQGVADIFEWAIGYAIHNDTNKY